MEAQRMKSKLIMFLVVLFVIGGAVQAADSLAILVYNETEKSLSHPQTLQLYESFFSPKVSFKPFKSFKTFKTFKSFKTFYRSLSANSFKACFKSGQHRVDQRNPFLFFVFWILDSDS